MNRMICTECKADYQLNDLRWKCDCGSILNIEFDAKIYIERIKSRKCSMWRYREALPIDSDDNVVTFDEGYTPLKEITVGSKSLLVKLEQMFTTGSYKDRGASVLISKAKELRVQEVVEDSSGNAGCAVAAYCAAAGIKCHIYVPEKTSPGKLVQIQAYGAELHKIPGFRENAAESALNAAEDIFYASHSYNPFFFQGTKTYAFEIWEQMNFNVPDTLIIPTGNGTLLIGAYLGFKDLLNCGLISRMPKIVAVQSINCAPLYKMFSEKLKELPYIKPEETITEGIAIAQPVRGRQILDIVYETGGEIIAVTDEEVKESLMAMCKKGLYIEPTSAASIAAFKKYGSTSSEIVVAPLTGHGLKSTEKFLKLLDN